jgi:hypothetical protein
MKETPDIFGIADITMLAVGIILFTGVLVLRTYIEGNGWWKVLLRDG